MSERISWARSLPGITIAAGVAIALTACAGSSGGSGTGSAQEIAFSDTTPAGVTALPEIVWNLPYGEPTSLDPAFSSSESNSSVVANMCESLLLQNPDFTTSPNLASVEQTDDVTFEVSIDDRATFWDGSPVTADDVKFSMERLRSDELGSTWAGVLSNIASIDIANDRELTIRLSQPDVLFAAHLATPAAAVVQKKFAEAAGEFGSAADGVMCSGPFELVKWSIGQDITLDKHAEYWNPEGAAVSDALRFTFNTDAASAATALQNGEVTGSYNFPVSALSTLEKSAGSLTFGTSLGLYGIMTINTDLGPLKDPKIREALELAIDYDGIIEGVFGGAAVVNKTFTPRSAWGYSVPIFEAAWDAVQAGTTDLDRAKAMVEEAGAPSDPIVLAYYADLPEDAQVAASVQASARSIGLEIELKAQTSAENIAMYFEEEARTGIDMMVWAGYLDAPEPAAYYQYYTSDGVFNVAGFSNPEFDDLVTTSRETIDDDARAELVTQAQAIYAENRINFPIISQYTRLYMAEGVSGAVASQAFYYSPWAAKVGGIDAA